MLSTITVNSLADNLTANDGLVTLREAVIAANTDATTDLGDTGSGADEIVFTVDGTITFDLIGDEDGTTPIPETGDLDITADLTITGNGTALTIIDAAGLDRAFEITAGVTVTLDSLAITGGSGSVGGAVKNAGTLTIIDSGLTGNEATGQTPSGSAFNIEVNFIDSNLTPSQQAIFSTAAARWEQIIIGDIPDVIDVEVGLIDDVRIDASAPAIDGIGGTLGQAGPTDLRGDGSFLPYRGVMEFDSADLADLEASGQLLDVIVHEMAHVLGFGTIWDDLGLIWREGSPNPRFTGPAAVAEYQSIFGVTSGRIPVANTGGAGTRDSHWRENTFDHELMTGYLDAGVVNPLSRVTVASMADLGYEVDITAADSYTPPAITTGSAQLSASRIKGRLLTIDPSSRRSHRNAYTDNTIDSGPNSTSQQDPVPEPGALTQLGGFADGGAVFNTGTLTVTTSTIDGNTALGSGGGIANLGTVTINGSTITNNVAASSGGGIASEGSLNIATSTVSNNQASDSGGGLDLISGTAVIVDTTISDNQSDKAGGIDNQTDLTLTGSLVSGNQAVGEVVVPISEYDIEVIFDDQDPLTESQQAIFTEAAARWEQIIIGDVPDVFVVGFGNVDDVVIDASAPEIDGVGSILGQAGPTAFRSGSFLPARGVMEFDSADLANLEASGQLLDVIIHEMGHVIGIGTIWDNLGLITGEGGADPRFTGSGALAEYNSIFGLSATSIPVANTGGAGTRDSHWREADFDNELMTGFLDSGFNPISRITTASLGDLGYVVNVDAADAYTPPTLTALQSQALAAGGVTGRLITLDLETVIIEPEGIVGPVVYRGLGEALTPSSDIASVTTTLAGLSSTGALGDGGGILNTGTLTATNTTMSGNTATGSGGGISNLGTLTIIHGTVTENVALSGGGTGTTGGGIHHDGTGATVHNTIVAGNHHGESSSQTSDDVAGTLDSASSFNLIGVDTGLTGVSDGGNGNQIGTAASPVNPLLGALADNGGPTLTHTVLVGSTAIDQGGAVTGSPSTDQRSQTRPVDLAQIPDAVVAGADSSDIGAVEVQQNELPLAPRVTEVLVASSFWSQTFLSNLTTSGIGNDDGYRIPEGASQLDNLTWDSLDQIAIRFDEPVQPPAVGDLTITGSDAPQPDSVIYDATTLTATWLLDKALPNGAFIFNLADTVQDTSGISLDGEFTDTDPFLSGDGSPGGAFSATVNVLVGDFNNDHLVDAADIDLIAAAIRDEATPVDPRLDLTGDGLLSFEGDTTYLVEQVLGTRLGDINLDLQVSIGDLSILSSNFGAAPDIEDTPLGWVDGDINGDNQVTIGDLSILSSNFGFDGMPV